MQAELSAVIGKTPNEWGWMPDHGPTPQKLGISIVFGFEWDNLTQHMCRSFVNSHHTVEIPLNSLHILTELRKQVYTVDILLITVKPKGHCHIIKSSY